MTEKLVPHWPAVYCCNDTPPYYALSDGLFATEAEARAKLQVDVSVFVRLAKEYPPSLLPSINRKVDRDAVFEAVLAEAEGLADVTTVELRIFADALCERLGL